MEPITELPWKYMPYEISHQDLNLKYKDELFILHACNAYPKLIEAIRAVWISADYQPEYRTDGVDLHALLKELGELKDK